MKKINNIALISLITATICVLAPISIPIGPVPITMATLVIMLIATLFEEKILLTSIFLYIFLGMVGLPVFSNMQGGFFVILSPTGGFIIGYIVFSIIIAKLYSRNNKLYKNFFALIIANIVLYIIGTIYYSIITSNSIYYSFIVCVLPFILVDMLKIIIVLAISNKMYYLLSGIIP